jgi:hypothetical protein
MSALGGKQTLSNPNHIRQFDRSGTRHVPLADVSEKLSVRAFYGEINLTVRIAVAQPSTLRRPKLGSIHANSPHGGFILRVQPPIPLLRLPVKAFVHCHGTAVPEARAVNVSRIRPSSLNKGGQCQDKCSHAGYPIIQSNVRNGSEADIHAWRRIAFMVNRC